MYIFTGADPRMVDQKDAKAIMKDVEVYLKNGTAYRHFVRASIIDGTTEAVSGWIAVNYLTQNVRWLCGIGGESGNYRCHVTFSISHR